MTLYPTRLNIMRERKPTKKVLSMMASARESITTEKQTPPTTPTECNFTDIFVERNSEAQTSIHRAAESTESLEASVMSTDGDQEEKNPENAAFSQTAGEPKLTSKELHAPSKEEGSGAINMEQSVYEEDNLIDAIRQDRPDAVEKLLTDGCNPNEPVDMDGNRPLHWAVLSENTNYVQMLLDAGVDVNLPGKRNTTPIMLTPAVYRCDAPWSIVHSLIKANCDINRVADSSKSTLHMAVQLGNVNIVKILMQYNVDINIQDSKGRSPIMYAGLLSGANILQYTTQYTFKDVEEIAYLLIKANAHVRHTDKFRQNALHLSLPTIELCDRTRVQQVSPSIIQMLELAGTKIPPKRFLRRWSSVSRETAKNVLKAIQWFETRRSVVRSLHHSCRLVIRKTLDQQIQHKLSQMTLPDKIKDYLMLPELDELVNQDKFL